MLCALSNTHLSHFKSVCSVVSPCAFFSVFLLHRFGNPHLAFATHNHYIGVQTHYIESTDLRVVVMLEHAAFPNNFNE